MMFGMSQDEGAEDAALEAAPLNLAKKPSTALSHDTEVGVK